MNMIKVKRLKIKKNPKFPNHCPFFDTNLIHEGSDFLSTAFLGLFGCIQIRPHTVKLYFMPEGNLTHNVTGILMVREHLPSRWRHWRFTQCENAAQILPLQPDHLKSLCLAVLYGSALSEQSRGPLAMAKNVLPALPWFLQLFFFPPAVAW